MGLGARSSVCADQLVGCSSARVVCVERPDDLSLIHAPGVVAVIAPLSTASWVEELAAAVTEGTFVMPRSILDGVSVAEIGQFLSEALNGCPLARSVRVALRDDLLELATACADLTGASRLRFRLFTDIPNNRCSYHIDVVPPRSPTVALIRVYCGARTEYIEPSNIVSWEAFYTWEFNRKREALAVAKARARKDWAAEKRAAYRLGRLDGKPSFLVQPDEVRTVPPDAIVACKFVDSEHLFDVTHVRAKSASGFVHRSPMRGEPRFVVTVNAAA